MGALLFEQGTDMRAREPYRIWLFKEMGEYVKVGAGGRSNGRIPQAMIAMIGRAKKLAIGTVVQELSILPTRLNVNAKSHTEQSNRSEWKQQHGRGEDDKERPSPYCRSYSCR